MDGAAVFLCRRRGGSVVRPGRRGAGGRAAADGRPRHARTLARGRGRRGRNGLLIADLGRPERFLNMLRVFRPTSPMSVGSWVLSAMGACVGPATLLSRAAGPLGTAGDVAAYGAALAGPPLSGYTAVLLANTAVPVWQEARRSMPWLFMASAVTSAAALLELLPATEEEHTALERFHKIGSLAELAAMAAVETEISRVPRVARPLREGALAGGLWRGAMVCAAAGLMLSILPARSRRTRLASSLFATASAVTVRFAIFLLGKASARDPRATFHHQRAGHGGAEVTTPAVAGDGRRASARTDARHETLGSGRP
ncbi:MAG TPA: NrfD/PsrC family molybdoenzyme membrane anchor subunit [bacterium]|nr:NrfD/PsrC family molybdoenzyme membrane anchor subunit [bacterium]